MGCGALVGQQGVKLRVEESQYLARQRLQAECPVRRTEHEKLGNGVIRVGDQLTQACLNCKTTQQASML